MTTLREKIEALRCRPQIVGHEWYPGNEDTINAVLDLLPADMLGDWCCNIGCPYPGRGDCSRHKNNKRECWCRCHDGRPDNCPYQRQSCGHKFLAGGSDKLGISDKRLEPPCELELGHEGLHRAGTSCWTGKN